MGMGVFLQKERGCNEILFSEKKGFFNEKGGGNPVNEGLVRTSTGKAIQ